MDNLFLFLLLLSLAGLVISLIKPAWLRMPSRKRAGLVFGGGVILFFTLFGVTAPPQSPANTAVATVNTPVAQTGAPSAPLTPEQKVQDAVTSQLQQLGSDASYRADEIGSDDTGKAGSRYVTIDVNTGESGSADLYLMDTGRITSAILPQIFPLDPTFNDVLVRYYGQVTDQYGNATTSMLMSYDMDRPLFSKINWSGLSSLGDDIYLCAYLREQLAQMSQSEQNNSYVGCVVLPQDLRSAEDKIETSNPQYKDIPHYGI